MKDLQVILKKMPQYQKEVSKVCVLNSLRKGFFSPTCLSALKHYELSSMSCGCRGSFERKVPFYAHNNYTVSQCWAFSLQKWAKERALRKKHKMKATKVYRPIWESLISICGISWKRTIKFSKVFVAMYCSTSSWRIGRHLGCYIGSVLFDTSVV